MRFQGPLERFQGSLELLSASKVHRLISPPCVWLTIVVCVLNILLNVSGLVMVLPGGLKALIAVQTIGFVLTLVLVVLPSTRRALAAAERPSRVR